MFAACYGSVIHIFQCLKLFLGNNDKKILFVLYCYYVLLNNNYYMQLEILLSRIFISKFENICRSSSVNRVFHNNIFKDDPILLRITKTFLSWLWINIFSSFNSVKNVPDMQDRLISSSQIRILKISNYFAVEK